MKRWYAVHTKPNCEHLVAGQLSEYARLEVYLPEIATDGDLAAKRRQAFFPGYLFVRLDLRKEQVSKWQWMQGLHSIVSYGDQAAEVPDKVILFLQRQLTAANNNPTVRKSEFRQGDNVRIKDGPFRDMIAILEGPSRPEARVHVLLSVMGRYHRLNVSTKNLEKVETGAGGKRPRGTRGSRGRGRPLLRDEPFAPEHLDT